MFTQVLKSLFGISIILPTICAQAQFNTANNGLSGSGNTVSLGGTLLNAQTSIDFGSSNSSASFLIKKGSGNYLSIGNDGAVKIYKGLVMGDQGSAAPNEHIINYLGTAQYDSRGLKLVDNTSGSIVRLHSFNNALYLTTDNGQPAGLTLGSRFNPWDGSEFRAGYQRWEIRAGSFSVNQDWLGNGQFEMTIGNAARKGILVKAAASQTANLQEWQNNSGSALSVVTSGGNMGIGTSSPNSNAKLDVNGNIFSNGKIAIGTTDMAKISTYALAVNGDALFTRVRVKTYLNWPDYVFEPKYILPPLSEIERFILENNHLPEVPSATEVEKEGLDIGDNQTLLLKKIEELTLYIIEQDKRIKRLEAQLQNKN